MAKQLEAELKRSKVRGAGEVLGQMQSLFDRISSGALNEPVRRAPGGRHFQDSDLPGDPRIRSLWTAFCDAVEGK